MADPGTPDADPFRSPWLLSAESSLLLVIDLQEKLLPAMRDTGLLLDRVERLLDGAALFDVPVIGTEQYPRGLGGTVASIAAKLGAPFEKLAFSGCGAAGLSAELARRGRRQIVLCGIETHVCVQQTALDLIAAGYDVHVPVDALSSPPRTRSPHRARPDGSLRRDDDDGRGGVVRVVRRGRDRSLQAALGHRPPPRSADILLKRRAPKRRSPLHARTARPIGGQVDHSPGA